MYMHDKQMYMYDKQDIKTNKINKDRTCIIIKVLYT